jgi:hypothetical protein
VFIHWENPPIDLFCAPPVVGFIGIDERLKRSRKAKNPRIRAGGIRNPIAKRFFAVAFLRPAVFADIGAQKIPRAQKAVSVAF